MTKEVVSLKENIKSLKAQLEMAYRQIVMYKTGVKHGDRTSE